MLPGYPGSFNGIRVEAAKTKYTSWATVKSLVKLGDEIIIDGDFFMPLASGLIVGYKF